MKLLKVVSACAVFGLIATGSQAQIINNPDVAGFRTFKDSSSNKVWLDLDNFFDKSYNQMKAAVEAAGFAVASRTEVEALVASLPNPDTNFASYKAIIGDAPNRELFWGAYLPTTDPDYAGYAYAYDSDQAWQVQDSSTELDFIQNGGSPEADMNIWAYQTTSSQVPEPGSLVFLGGLGVALAMGKIRRRK